MYEFLSCFFFFAPLTSFTDRSYLWHNLTTRCRHRHTHHTYGSERVPLLLHFWSVF